MTTVEVWAPAKINLTLHVTGRREDGYHLLDSLVAFGPMSDHLNLRKANTLSLTVEGPETAGVPADFQNLVMRVADRMSKGRGVSLTLTKNLPAAAGIGGGSADAAAAVRGLLLLWQGYAELDHLMNAPQNEACLGDHWRWLADLGADVPMCLTPRPQRVRGIGEQIEFVDLPHLPAVLVNPRVAVSTPEVFSRLEVKENAPMPDSIPSFHDCAALVDWLQHQRNDLEIPAKAIAPEIEHVLGALQRTEGCELARMSGSGATCFGLYADEAAAQQAASRLGAEHPDWWVSTGNLGQWMHRAEPRFT